MRTSTIASRKTRQAGFTLVELLVVTAMIGGLSSLVFFGAQGAISASKQAASTTNMRNIGLAMRMYADDNAGKFPETTHTASLGQAWIYSLEGYMGDFDDTRICPADPKKNERRKASGSSYILNSYIFVPPPVSGFRRPSGPQLNRLSAIPEPSRTLMAFVCADRTGTGAGNDHTHSNLWRSWGAVCNDISPDRFGGGAKASDKTRGRSIYLYVDGRVEALPANEVKSKIERGLNIAKPPGVEGLL